MPERRRRIAIATSPRDVARIIADLPPRSTIVLDEAATWSPRVPTYTPSEADLRAVRDLARQMRDMPNPFLPRGEFNRRVRELEREAVFRRARSRHSEAEGARVDVWNEDSEVE